MSRLRRQMSNPDRGSEGLFDERDAHAALEDAGQHAEKRLRRHKRRLKNHRQQAEVPNDIISAPMSIYAAATQLDLENGHDNANVKDAEQEDDSLPIIAELSYEVESLSVEQAVMRLELSGDNCLLFRNSGHMGLNMVHLRNDGTIGWVDPRGTRDLNEAS